MSQAIYRITTGRRLVQTAALVFCVSFLRPACAITAEVDPETALKTCMAAQPEQKNLKKKKDKRLSYVFKGAAQEAGANLSGMAKDMVFVFSVQDIDPYKKSAPTDRPYTLLSARLVDGTMCKLVKYPDNSGKVVGGFADGTIIAPLDDQTFVVGYPNGARGRLEKLPGGGCKIYRPDKTVTTLTKSPAGRYSIRNTELGYMGEATPDRSGLQFEFKNDDTF